MLHCLKILVLFVRRLEETVIVLLPGVDQDRVKDDEYAIA